MRFELLSIDRVQWRSRSEIEALQWRRFKRLVSHAQLHSPYYRRRFKEVGIDAADIRSREDLEQLPITRREDLRNSEELVAEGYDPNALKSSTTSGSTGRRTVSYFDGRGWFIAKYLLKLRARWACGLRPWDRIALLQEGAPDDGWFKKHLLRQHKFTIDLPINELLAAVAPIAPTALYGFPGHLRLLAQMHDGALKPKAVFTSGEMLAHETRQKIEQSFAAPLYDIYGSTETKEIAWQCPERDGYHINADWVLIECIDERILVTNLYNFGMPLLRYEVGDTGHLLEHECACGRGLPMMMPQLGRSVDYFRLENGERIAPYTMTCAIEDIAGMHQYQIAQMAPAKVVLNVVPEPGFDHTAQQAIVAALQPVLPGCDIRVVVVDRIEAEPSGKYRIVLSHVDAQ